MNPKGLLRVLCLPTGPDEYAIAMVRALSKIAMVTLVAPATMVERFGTDIPDGVATRSLAWPRHRDPRNILLLGRILQTIRTTKPDVIHFLGDSVLWLTLGLPLLRGFAKVVTVHDVTYHPGDVQSRTVPTTTVNLLRRSADELIVHGPGLRHALHKSGIAGLDRIHVVDHPVLDRHRRLAASMGLTRTAAPGPRILFFGRVMAYKGLNLLMEASDHVVRCFPHARFLVAGTGPELERLRHDLQRRPWIEVRDYYIPDLETAQILCDADLLVLPYIEASQSGVLTLAAGFGLPVVTTDVGELGALTRRTGMGPVVRPEPGAIAQAIINLLSDPASLRRFSAAADKAALGALSPRIVAADTLAVYRRAIARRHPPLPAFTKLERG